MLVFAVILISVVLEQCETVRLNNVRLDAGWESG